ncbi:hypothetical protein [Candidatus Nitrososphaera sp. FF02]|uniref:hypothetical protein n=1 Tax=Candidatus Nitrososphaera sp. FF02 TaxID=3398226 RepID=UPI0039EB9271
MQRANQFLALVLAAILAMSALASISIPAPIALPAFADEHDDDGDAESEDDDSNESEDEAGEQEDESETKLKPHGDGIEIEIERTDLGLANGLYNVTFSCTSPSISKGFDGAFEVEDGEGEFEVHIALENGTYTGCKVMVDEPVMTLASFELFKVSQETKDRNDEHDDDSERVKEHRKERAENAESKVRQIRERIANAQAASPGPVARGMNYTLTASETDEAAQDVSVDLDLVTWKSTHAIAIMAIVGGEVEVDDKDYTVVIGYAIYSLRHDATRISALAVDDATGDVVKLTLRGGAAEDSEFPDAVGESIDLLFEGSSGPHKNRIGGVELSLDGTLKAV